MALLETTTAEGALRGMVLARAPHELTDQEAAYLQDALLNQPGFVSRRGAITGTTTIAAANLDSMQPAAICSVYDPAGVQKIGVIYFKDTGSLIETWLAVFDTSLAFIQKHQITPAFAAANYPARPAIVTTVPAIDGSVIISVRTKYDRSSTSEGYVVKWYGGTPPASTRVTPTFSTATLISGAIGTTHVTGTTTEIAKLSVGTVIEGYGVVASITSTTQVELSLPLIAGMPGTPLNYYAVEGLGVVRARGAISCALGVAAGQVIGYGTKFTEAWDNAFTAADPWVMTDPADGRALAHEYTSAATVISDTLLQQAGIGGDRASALRNYILEKVGTTAVQGVRWRRPDSTLPNTPYSAKGNLWANYKGIMVSFNGLASNSSGITPGETKVTNRAWIHGPRIPEIMDHSNADGDWFPVVATKGGDEDGIAAIGGRNACVLCKSQETFALFGDNAENFSLAKIADDGALSAEAVTSYNGDCVWLGRTGIWRFDGKNPPVNVVKDTLGIRWQELVSAFDTKAITRDSNNVPLNQARCFVYRDHLFVNVTNTGSVHSVYTDGVSRTQNSMQLMIYLPTGAASFLSNFNFTGFVQIGRAGYTLLPQNGSTTHHIFPLDNLFTQGLAATDVILTTNVYNSGTLSTSVGPWFHMESRKFSAGDGLRRKTWKQLSLEYLMTNTKRVFLETVSGLNTVGVRQTTPYVGTGLFKAFKNKFNARDQYMSFRLYEDINNRPDTLKLGAWQWAFKLARRGQV